MQSLVDIVLLHLKANVNNLMKTDSLWRLDANLLLKLAEKFNNCDVEAIEDYEDKEDREHFKEFVYCSLLYSLSSPKPENERGHFWSLHNAYKCKHCEKVLPSSISQQVACVSGRFSVEPTGEVISAHETDNSWNLSKHVNNLRDHFDCDWGRIYWKIWAECHYLLCVNCQSYYPVNDPKGCRRHIQEPLFYFIEEEGISTQMNPIGRFTCCNEKAYRYNTSPQLKDYNGCKITNHEPRVLETNDPDATITNDHNAEIIRINNTIKHEFCDKDGIKNYSCAKECVDDVVVNNTFQCQHSVSNEEVGLIERGLCALKTCNGEFTLSGKCESSSSIHHIKPLGGKDSKIVQRRDRSVLHEFMNACCIESKESDIRSRKPKSRSKATLCFTQKCSSDEGFYNEGCCLPMQDINAEERYFNRPIQYSKRTAKHKRTKCGLKSDQWVNVFSTRFNQDKQREYENRFFNRLRDELTKRAECNGVNYSTKDVILSEWPVDGILLAESVKGNICPPNSVNSHRVSSDYSDESDSGDCTSSYCSTLNSCTRTRHSRTTSIWNSHTPLAGSYMLIDTENRGRHSNDRAEYEDEIKRLNDCNGLLPRLNSHLNKKNQKKQPTFIVQHNHFSRKYTRLSNKNEPSSPMLIKTKMLELPVLKDKNSEDFYKAWSYDESAQELNYLSATYIPLSVTFKTRFYKYFKTLKFVQTHEWNDLIDLEKSWDAFLNLFFENESWPYHNSQLKLTAQVSPINEQCKNDELKTTENTMKIDNNTA